MSQEVKILVCDQNQIFLRYFRKRFPEFKFVFYTDLKNNIFSFYEFDRIIFIQDGPLKEYIRFLRQFEGIIPMIFGIYMRKPISDKYEISEIANVNLLYLLETKTEISDQLKEYLDDIVTER
ncbi:hypothetical protein [Flavobacterium poyangense]|uniref:hypothetical protein n=1 Tax=Flavobacterium poyangense TaxID=2204302 RepID=UPI001421C558|nr:hypothetical protein [Flavobacterium sp. JXAS1]